MARAWNWKARSWSFMCYAAPRMTTLLHQKIRQNQCWQVTWIHRVFVDCNSTLQDLISMGGMFPLLLPPSSQQGEAGQDQSLQGWQACINWWCYWWLLHHPWWQVCLHLCHPKYHAHHRQSYWDHHLQRDLNEWDQLASLYLHFLPLDLREMVFYISRLIP